MEHSLIERLISRIQFNLPKVEEKHPKVRNTTKKEESYHHFHNSVQYHEVMDADNNPQLRITTHTYQRQPRKQNSRRDIIREIGGKAFYNQLFHSN